MTKFKILHFINVRFYNATAWYGIFLSKILNENGHKSILVGLDGTESYLKAKDLALPIMKFPYNKNKKQSPIEAYKLLDKIFTETKPDIVNCHRGELFLLIALLKRKHGFILVRTRGDQRPVKKNIFNKILYNNLADIVISSNSSIKKQLHEKLHLPLKNIHTIIGGVDRNVFFAQPQIKDAMRKKYGYTSKDCVLGLLGRLDPIKGQKESIIALAKAIEQDGKNLKLLIIGFDELTTSEELYTLAKSLNVSKHVQITGKISNVPQVLNMCDVGILPSIGSEAIARAALEFMACGIPLISSQVGVMPDLVSSEGLFKTNDTADMAKFFLKVSKALDYPTGEEYKWINRLKSQQQELLPQLSLPAFMEKTLKAYDHAFSRHKRKM